MSLRSISRAPGREVQLWIAALVLIGGSTVVLGQPEHDHEQRGAPHFSNVEQSSPTKPDAVAQRNVLRGQVFVDLDGDGQRSTDEYGLPDIGVSNGVEIVLTNRDGAYELSMRPDIGLVYISMPRGYHKDAQWYLHVSPKGHASSLDFPLTPSHEQESFRFAQTSDTHVGRAGATGAALAEALIRIESQQSQPAFIITTGDLVDKGKKLNQFREYIEAVSNTSLPYFNVFGNHDVGETGVDSYRRYLGPDYYSFDFRDCHFLIINSMIESPEQSAWIQRDLELLSPGKRLFIFQHHPPTGEEHDRFVAMDATAVFTGHYHSQRAVTVGEMMSYSTTSLLFGGIDCSPAGFRMVEVTASSVTTRMRWMTDGTMIQLVSPQSETLMMSGALPLIINAYETSTRFTRGKYTLRQEGRIIAEGSLRQQGDWSWRADIPLPERGAVRPRLPDEFELHAELLDDQGFAYALDSYISVIQSRTPLPKPGGHWPQFGGGPMRGGLSHDHLPPPLSLVWAVDTGGEFLFSSPVLRDDTLVVGVKGRDTLADSGVLALDAASGEKLWFAPTPAGVTHTVATDEARVFACSQGGWLHAFEIDTGKELWRRALGSGHQRFMNAAPLVVGPEVFAGSFVNFARFRASDGNKRWWYRWGAELTGYGSPATDGSLVLVAGLWKPNSLQAVDMKGEVVWEYPARGLHGSPVISDESVLFTEYGGTIAKLNLADGKLLWKSDLGGERSASTPAVAQGRVVAGGLGHIQAFSMADGTVLWDVPTRKSTLNMAPYGTRFEALVGSPTIAGSTVYVPCGDGWLYAIDLVSGEVLWEMDFGVPILSAPCIAGGFLYLTTFDGHVYALAPMSQCIADCDLSTGFGTLDIFDFLCFQSSFTQGGSYACDCNVTSGPGVCDIFDFLCFQNAFVNGCP